MRKILFALLLFCSTTARAQFSDMSLDSCAFVESLRMIETNYTGSEWFFQCEQEYDLHPGYNLLCIFTLRNINHGPHAADFWEASNQQDIIFDPCHHHAHVKAFNVVSAQNECGDTVTASAKIGFNMADGLNFYQWLQTGGTCAAQWLSSYMALDFSLSTVPASPLFDGDDHLGLSPGWCDTYSAQAIGNSVNFTNVPTGGRKFLLTAVGNYSRYFNQGLNLAPDTIRAWVTIDGTQISPTAPGSNTAPTAPASASLDPNPSGPEIVISWPPAQAACKYVVTPYNENTGRTLSNLAVTVAVPSCAYPRAALVEANTELLIKGAGKYRFKVQAQNGAGISAATLSTGKPANVNK